MKKIIAPALVIAAGIISLAACGGNGGSTSAGKSAPSTSAPAPAATAAPSTGPAQLHVGESASYTYPGGLNTGWDFYGAVTTAVTNARVSTAGIYPNGNPPVHGRYLVVTIKQSLSPSAADAPGTPGMFSTAMNDFYVIGADGTEYDFNPDADSWAVDSHVTPPFGLQGIHPGASASGALGFDVPPRGEIVWAPKPDGIWQGPPVAEWSYGN